MASIDDLANPHFLKLSNDEQIALIVKIRAARRYVPQVAKTPKTKTTKPRKHVLTNELAGMSKEQFQLLSELLNAD